MHPIRADQKEFNGILPHHEVPVLDDIQAAFGLLKAKKSVSLEAMDAAILQEAAERNNG